MKTYKIMLILLLILNSCQDDIEFKTPENNQKDIVTEKTVRNGRFIFSSKESLKNTIDSLKDKDIEKVEIEFEKLYEKGFRSHKAIIGPENEHLQSKISNEIALKRQFYKSSSKQFNNEDNESEFIGDPLLAAIVNENHEIIINDTLYKFTEDKGLFFAHVKDSSSLFSFFQKENQDKSNSRLSISPCRERTLYGGYTKINSKISRYIRPIEDEDECTNINENPINISPSPVAKLTEEDKLNEIINNLPICDGRARGNWVQNIFGKSYVCRNYFDSKHRIKTEFWDQSWGIYKSVGILTKTQRKRFGIWWASKSDEIHLGINHILLRYNFPQPQINSYSHPDLFPLNSYKNPIYLWDNKLMVSISNTGPSFFVDTQLNISDGKLPFFDFGNDKILNIYIPKLYKKGKYNLNLTTQDITSQSNIKQLYKMGIDFLNSSSVANSGKKKTFAVTYQKDHANIEVIYFAERLKKTNDNYIKKKFYSDLGFTISWAWNDKPKPIMSPNGTGTVITTDYSGTGKFSIKTADDYFRNYTYYKLDFYGMAKRGNTWKGNRMIK